MNFTAYPLLSTLQLSGVSPSYIRLTKELMYPSTLEHVIIHVHVYACACGAQ